jgi:hypothetical protein
MKITPVPYKLQLQQDSGRSKGVHLSNIVRDIALKTGFLKPQYASEKFEDIDPTKMELGMAWEDRVFTIHHPEVLYHPGEVIVDGVAMTTDGLSYGWIAEGAVHECKLTWKSKKRELDLFGEWMWLAQTMSYCYGHQMTTAMYHIFWINGDYKRGEPSGNPSYSLYKLEFTWDEILENWNAILNHGRDKYGI